MAWTAPRTWVTSEVVTAAVMNTHVRDNLVETATAKVTTAGDLVYASGSTALARLGAGDGSQFLKGGSTPSWSDQIDGDLKLDTTSGHLKLYRSDSAIDVDDNWGVDIANSTDDLRIFHRDDSTATTTELMEMTPGDVAYHSGSAGNGVGAVLIGTDTAGSAALTTSGAIVMEVNIDANEPGYIVGHWMAELERTSAASTSGVQITIREDGNNLSPSFSYQSGNTGIADIISGANDIFPFTGMFYRRLTTSDDSDHEVFISADDNSRFQINRGALIVQFFPYPT